MLNKGLKVFRDKNTKNFYVNITDKSLLNEMIAHYGAIMSFVDQKPNNLIKIKSLKIGLFDYYGGSIPSGWTRWMLEQFGYSYELFYPQNINSVDLKKYDILLFIGEGLPYGIQDTFKTSNINRELVPVMYHPWMGNISKINALPVLKKFVNEGGKILTVGVSSNWVYDLELGIDNPLLERNSEGKMVPFSSKKYFIPTSILSAQIETEIVENYGMPRTINLVFNNSPVFQFLPNDKLYSLGRFTTDQPLVSGWALGQQYLKDSNIGVVAKLGKGKIIAIGPEITNRAQSHGTFKMLFNHLYE